MCLSIESLEALYELRNKLGQKGLMDEYTKIAIEIRKMEDEIYKTQTIIYQEGIVNTLHRNPNNWGSDVIFYYMIKGKTYRDHCTDIEISRKKFEDLLFKMKLNHGWVKQITIQEWRNNKIKLLI